MCVGGEGGAGGIIFCFSVMYDLLGVGEKWNNLLISEQPGIFFISHLLQKGLQP